MLQLRTCGLTSQLTDQSRQAASLLSWIGERNKIDGQFVKAQREQFQQAFC